MQGWPRQEVPLQGIRSVEVCSPQGSTCCIPQSTHTVNITFIDAKSSIQLAGIAHPFRFCDNVIRAQKGVLHQTSPNHGIGTYSSTIKQPLLTTNNQSISQVYL
jgi:hypothetical protein